MQFFHLLSFVVVASYAAALPQPAGLSEQYSNNADNSLASDLETRSYQPAFNSQKGSPTLMSLERRADSAGSSGERVVFGTAPISTLSPEEARKLIDSLFKKEAFSFANISSTIEKAGNGFAELSESGEKAGTKIGGSVGDLLSLYLRRSTYVNLVLTVSLGNEGEAITSFIKSITAPAELPKALLAFFQKLTDLTTEADKKEAESDGFIVNILKDSGTVAQNVEDAIKLLVETVNNFVKFFDVLKTLMSKSQSGKTFYDDISSMMESLTKFNAKQQNIHDKIIKALKVVPPK
ncbi:hypothetical protein BASA50_005774 [Batrachochytrium salamandrivorans]|uniref:Uncharacterized protein n=1 Tax=Batrachochytrium salamandrivorans TaxID=1357716 RepID=A0ABQ8FEP0_9FUNG|nr:hypothetical protein BASA62_009136 [Batrachochytrium salamandrivorans]KAH6582394.1 hypothetical protein BASA60_001952 [Batrachochytrium salamandrivorans]KAH6595502.1 hypothetical protein BASA50_005774 [Batrachochytrium salamandrivorans]KAH9249161.1 hypothetical protein BASA81_013120 [Batrachochytrium salamandrivorans]KAH9269550.1 hypothetical protein BASA83_008370 [Batrachochytrium salamandrivorans]